MTDRSLKFAFLGEDKGLGRTMAGLGKQTDTLHLSLGKLAGAFSGALAGAGAVDFLKTSISNASDLNESLSKTRVVFGSASKGVEVFAKAAATGIGQSQQDALEATSTFGNLFRALGIGTKPAADLSVKMVKLAGDLASFNNVDPAEALDALKSGLLGEAEPLRKFGVTLSETRIKAEAMADGIVKPTKDAGKVRTALLNVEVATRKLAEAQKGHGASTVAVQVAQRNLTEAQKKYGKGSLEAQVANERLTKANEALGKSHKDSGPHSLAAKIAADNLAKANVALAKATKGTVPELTAAQKAQAAYAIVMKDTRTAQGDFSRTSGGLANQQRILKAEFSDASAQLGTKLLPFVTKVEHKMTDALKPGSKFRDVLADLGDKAKGFADDAKPIFSFIGDHPDLFKEMAKDAVILGGALKAKSFLTGLSLLKGVSGGRLPGVGGALGGAVKGSGPVPVYVTNEGFGKGGGVLPGGGVARGAEGAALSLGGAVTISVLGTAAIYEGNKYLHDHPDVGSPFFKHDDPISTALFGKPKSRLDDKTRKQGIADILKYDDVTTPESQRLLKKWGYGPVIGPTNRDDDKRSMQQQRRVDQVVTSHAPAETKTRELQRITNNTFVNVYGVTDLSKIIAQAHRQSRIHALGSVNNSATRDRNM